MAKAKQAVTDAAFLNAALEGLELQRKRIDEQIQQVKSLLGGKKPRVVPAAAAGKSKPAAKRELSETARKRIAKAQKKRWAAYRKAKRAAGKAGV
jgi:hypothetical protein